MNVCPYYEGEEKTMETQLKTLLENLKSLRDHKDVLDAQYALVELEFRQKNEYIIRNRQDVREAIDKIETDIRKLGATIYDGVNKDIGFGVKIRVMKKLEYDTSVAFAWAKEHNLALSFDKKAFEEIAKSTPIEFVKSVESATVTIPTKIEF